MEARSDEDVAGQAVEIESVESGVWPIGFDGDGGEALLAYSSAAPLNTREVCRSVSTSCRSVVAAMADAPLLLRYRFATSRQN